MISGNVRRTTHNKLVGTIRILLAVVFLMSGAMKLLVPMLADAWAGQLLAANLPLYSISRWTVPFLEILLGIALAVGVFVRPAVVLVIGIMAMATYVHVVVDDSSLFPLQPREPIIPPIVIALSTLILWQGAGAWSLDLRAFRRCS
ncbi:MAG: DoxX family protein [Paracoccaceae bacterium]